DGLLLVRALQQAARRQFEIAGDLRQRRFGLHVGIRALGDSWCGRGRSWVRGGRRFRPSFFFGHAVDAGLAWFGVERMALFGRFSGIRLRAKRGTSRAALFQISLCVLASFYLLPVSPTIAKS